jgi:hypothetical protein
MLNHRSIVTKRLLLEKTLLIHQSPDQFEKPVSNHAQRQKITAMGRSMRKLVRPLHTIRDFPGDNL